MLYYECYIMNTETKRNSPLCSHFGLLCALLGLLCRFFSLLRSRECAAGNCLQCRGRCAKCLEHRDHLARLKQLEEHTLYGVQVDARCHAQQTVLNVTDFLDFAAVCLASSDASVLQKFKQCLFRTFDISLLPPDLKQQLMELGERPLEPNELKHIEIHDCSSVTLQVHVSDNCSSPTV